MPKDIVSNIKLIGEQQDKKIQQIGENSGVGKNAIYRWNDLQPKISTLKKVADYLDVDYKTLLP